MSEVIRVGKLIHWIMELLVAKQNFFQKCLELSEKKGIKYNLKEGGRGQDRLDNVYYSWIPKNLNRYKES